MSSLCGLRPVWLGRATDGENMAGGDAVARALDGAFAGELIARGDAQYETARRVWNGMVDRKPAVIARCAHEGDVVAALRVARAFGLPVAVRGGVPQQGCWASLTV